MGDGEKLLRTPGPVLLIPNHVSWLDWLFLGVVLEDDWKFVVASVVAERSWIHRKIIMNPRTLPVEMGSPNGLKKIAKYLKGGGRLVLFAEGRISRTGTLMKLYEGTGFLAQQSNATILLGYLRGANRLKCTEHKGWTQWFPKVELHVEESGTLPQFPHLKPNEQRQKLTSWLTRRMMDVQFQSELSSGPQTIPAAVMELARKRPSAILFQDVNDRSVTAKQLIIGADLIAREIENLIGRSEKRLGLLLPNVVANPVSLMASWFLGATPTTFNYTSGPVIMNQCAQLAGIKYVITSRAFLEKAAINISIMEESGVSFIYLEDLRKNISFTKKVGALNRFNFEPELIDRGHLENEDTAIILFTSGSEGVPKGVELTHRNFLANVEQVLAVTDINETDRIFNALPLFHSFGLTIGTILPMTKGIYTFLFPNPLSYKVIPSVVYDMDCTVTMGTNTFLTQYARNAHPMDFRNIRYLVAGAEKLQDATFDLWSEKFGVRILQGYGATETSPVVSVNTHMFHRKGTTGLPLPGMDVDIQQVDGVDRGGRVVVKGPNVMKGYLNSEPNEKFKALNGWYDTGDIGEIDQDGYLRLLGRLKRFAKISGEMVSLTAVEEALTNHIKPMLGEEFGIAVVAKPDESKGEKLVAYHTASSLDNQLVKEAVLKSGLSALCIPKDLRHIDEIPTLGTGKVDHKALSALAAE